MSDYNIIKYYYTKTNNFSKYNIYILLNKRGNWKPTNSFKNSNLCIISGYFRTCSNILECKRKIIDTNCKKSKIRGDFDFSGIDYLLNKNIFSLGNKSELFLNIKKKYRNVDYIPLTYDINKNTFNKIDKTIFNKNRKFILKPVEGYERQGQLTSNDPQQIDNQLKKYNQFKNWQLQEFIESYGNSDFFIRAVFVLISHKNEFNCYISTYNEFTSVKNKKTGYVSQSIGKWVFFNDDCQLVSPLKKSEYTGKLGIAHEEIDKMVKNKGYYKKYITPQINKIIKEIILSTQDKFKKSNDQMSFHIFGADLMINKKLEVKLLEVNPYPTHFANARSECVPLNIIEKIYGGKENYDKLVKYEVQMLDEIFSLTIDKVYKTDRKVKLKILQQIL